MARNIGPRCRLSRREGVDLLLTSGARSLDSKCKASVAPGQFGDRQAKVTDYGKQLRMKQLIKRYYGVLERQFQNYYRKAEQAKGASGDNLIKMLEMRLDNIVYRLGLAATRAEARQMINHRAVEVNHEVVNIASYLLKPGDVVSIREQSKKQARIVAAVAASAERGKECDWLSADRDNLSGEVKRYPENTEFPKEFKVHLVIELYSK